jgi:6-phospho-3-hexuloisomerase
MDEVAAAERRPWLAVGDEIAEVLGRIDEREFGRVVAELADPDRRWFFSGQGRSGFVAEMAAMRFTHLGRRVHVPGEATAPSIRQGDGIVFISGSGEKSVTLHFAEVAKQEGARIIVVTRAPASTLAKMADAVLTLPVQQSAQFGGSLFEQVALLLMDALVLAVSAGQTNAYKTMRYTHTNLQ